VPGALFVSLFAYFILILPFSAVVAAVVVVPSALF